MGSPWISPPRDCAVSFRGTLNHRTLTYLCEVVFPKKEKRNSKKKFDKAEFIKIYRILLRTLLFEIDRASISRHRRISKVTLISEGKKRRTFFPACKNRCLNSDGSKTASLNDGQSREFITFFENWYSSVDKWSSKKRILLKIPSRFIRRGNALEIKISSFVKDNKKEEQEGRNHSCRRASMTKTRNTEKQIFGKQTSGKNTGSYTYIHPTVHNFHARVNV